MNSKILEDEVWSKKPKLPPSVQVCAIIFWLTVVLIVAALLCSLIIAGFLHHPRLTATLLLAAFLAIPGSRILYYKVTGK